MRPAAMAAPKVQAKTRYLRYPPSSRAYLLGPHPLNPVIEELEGMQDSLSTSYLFIHLHTSFPPHTKRQLVDKMHILLRPSPKLSARPLYPPCMSLGFTVYYLLIYSRSHTLTLVSRFLIALFFRCICTSDSLLVFYFLCRTQSKIVVSHCFYTYSYSLIGPHSLLSCNHPSSIIY